MSEQTPEQEVPTTDPSEVEADDLDTDEHDDE